MSPFHVWVTEVQRVPALAELGLRSCTTSSPRSRPSLPSDGVPVLSLCPPDPRWPGAVWIGEPGTGDLGPGSQQPPAQGPPDAEQQCQDHLGLGRTQPLWVTPETTSAGDVVFKLSLRRKKKARGQQREEVAWAGPPGESRPAPLTLGLVPTGAANNAGQFPCALGGIGSGTLGVWETGGEAAPPSVSPRESGEPHQHRGGAAGSGRISLREPAAHPCWWPGSGGHSCLLSTSHHWAVGASRQVEAQKDKGAVLGSHSL